MAEAETIPHRDKYPPLGFHFNVVFANINGSPAAVDSKWQEVTGMTQEITTEEVDEGGENLYSYKLPKKVKYGNLTLKRGVMLGTGLVEWLNNAFENFTFKPAEVSVTLWNDDQEPLVTWDFHICIPIKWSSSDLKAQDSALVIETLELAYQSYTKRYHNAD